MRLALAIRRSGRRGLAAAIALLLGLAVSAAAAAELEMRTWTSQSGRQKIRAKLVAFEMGKVTLEKADGKTVEIELSKLSFNDHRYVTSHAVELWKAKHEKEPKAGDDSPFRPKDTTPEAAAAPEVGSAKIVSPDWSAAELVAPVPEQGGWKLAVPPANSEPPQRKAEPVPLPRRENFFEQCSGLVMTYAGQRALVSYNWEFQRPQPQTRIVLCDLVRGKKLLAAKAAGKLRPLALSDNGAAVVMAGEKKRERFGNETFLELWNLSPAGIAPAWRVPGSDSGQSWHWAAFLDGERLAIAGGGKVAVVTAASGQPVFYVACEALCTPGLSPDRRYLAFAQSGKLCVLDLSAGKMAAAQSVPQLTMSRFCFSPDGARLACVDPRQIRVWSLADGTLWREIDMRSLKLAAGEVAWPDPRYLMFDHRSLVDLESQAVVWGFEGGEQGTFANGVCLFATGGANLPMDALVSAHVPPPGLTARLEKAMQEPDFYVLKPGVTVKLDLAGLADAAERDKAAAALTKKLQSAGAQVGPAGTIELKGSTSLGEEKKISYHGFGVSPWQEHTVRDYLSSIAFVYQGKTVWQASASSVPLMIQLSQGETIDQALRRSEKFDYRLFQSVELPKLLVKPTDSPVGFGATRVSIHGVE
jgi:hypothetical protein